MYIERKQDLAVYYYVKNLFADAPFINVVEGFPENELILPTIAIELDSISTYTLELGNRAFGKVRSWYIDIFASNKSQRDEFAFRLLHDLENKIVVYDYDQGFPPVVLPILGVLDPDDVQVRIIKVLPELTELMYYRSVVSFTAVYEDI